MMTSFQAMSNEFHLVVIRGPKTYKFRFDSIEALQSLLGTLNLGRISSLTHPCLELCYNIINLFSLTTCLQY